MASFAPAPSLSVIAPIYNEEANIAALYERLSGVLAALYELLFVGDGSHDASLPLLRGLAARDGWVRYLDFSRNFGHQIAVMAGLNQVRGAAVVIIDADLQDPREQGESQAKKFTAKFFCRILARITRIFIPVGTGDFRVLPPRATSVDLSEKRHPSTGCVGPTTDLGRALLP